MLSKVFLGLRTRRLSSSGGTLPVQPSLHLHFGEDGFSEQNGRGSLSGGGGENGVLSLLHLKDPDGRSENADSPRQV